MVQRDPLAKDVLAAVRLGRGLGNKPRVSLENQRTQFDVVD